MAAVELRRVAKSYDGRTTVIHGIDLEIAHGEFVVFVGPSGCGKSTLLRMIAGLEPISGGEVLIDGTVVNALPPRHRDIAMVFQDYALYPHKTLFENMAFGLRLRHTPEAEIQRRVGEAAALLKIESMLQRKPRELSGGQRQRVAIGRAIVRQPKVFLFDEPLSNLDAQLRHEMRTEIKRLHQRLGATIVYVTHDQTEAMTLADRICVLQGGHRMQYDTPEAIYNRPAAVFVAGFTGAPPMNLADCTVADGCADLGGVALPLPHHLRGHSGALTLGVRPENLTLAPQAATDLALPATLQLLEPLGAETLITVRIGAAEMVARVSAAFHQAPGTPLALHVDSRKLHLFDRQGGQALA
ncbi:ABC transporter ATP-binding protein [Ideonella sp. A 288]|uniref:ABC transporter ATP-binding protein n=1 Tax=Ideonella sp. A 288 TaxID=1962181 RepID=UPI000B4AEF26|nr:sn-glycerol-3-phosphate ABC transporter ATP-binding protein UgpC [Ideonella sp. A 288]